MPSIDTTILVLNEFEEVNPGRRTDYLMYLIQILCSDLGYRHEWRGAPFSNTLRETLHDYHDNKEDYDKEIAKTSLKNSVIKKLARVKEIIQPPLGISQDNWIEMLVTIHYLKNICYVPEFEQKITEPNLNNSFRLLNKNRKVYITRTDPKREFELLEFKLAWTKLEQLGLLNKKHIRPET